MIDFQDYKHCIKVQIRFSDIDRIDHVNNAVYLNYFETARVDYFNTVFNNRNNWNENGFVLARNEINHIQPIHLGDEIYCFTKMIQMGTKSLTLKNAIIKKTKNGYVECANGIGILVAMNYKTGESMPLLEEWRIMMENYEK